MSRAGLHMKKREEHKWTIPVVFKAMCFEPAPCSLLYIQHLPLRTSLKSLFTSKCILPSRTGSSPDTINFTEINVVVVAHSKNNHFKDPLNI